MDILERFRLDGKTALVTGAGRGLGRGFALALAQAGADVALADLDAVTAADSAAMVARETGRRTLAITVDISRADEVERMVREVTVAFGRLDIAVNNAGMAIPIQGLDEVSRADWDRQLGVNLHGTWLCLQAEAAAMLPNGYGKIINIGSICGHIVWPDPQLAYSVSKAGVIHLTRCAAAELIRHGIRVNCLSPGVTRVADLFPEVVGAFFKTAPIDRVGTPEDHQGAVVFLASAASDFMVGQEMIIDGGYTIM